MLVRALDCGSRKDKGPRSDGQEPAGAHFFLVEFNTMPDINIQYPYDEMNAAYKKAIELMKETILAGQTFSVPRALLTKHDAGEMTREEFISMLRLCGAISRGETELKIGEFFFGSECHG